jgi:hypothetical protein
LNPAATGPDAVRKRILINFFAADCWRLTRRFGVRSEVMRVRGIVAALAMLGVLACWPAAALASSNAASAQVYVQADYALVRVARSHLAISDRAPAEVLARVEHECPGAGAGSPQNAESTDISNEVVGTIALAAAQPDVSAATAFLHATAKLSWSDAALTKTARKYAVNLKTELGLTAPNVCTEVKAWAASGFHALPAPTVAFAGKFVQAWEGMGLLPAGLARYESGPAKTLARRAAVIEQELAEGEARGVEDWGKIMDTLELWP